MKIIPLKTGTIKCNKSILTLGKDFDQNVEIPATAWYVRAGKTNLLVDTGMCDSRRANRYHYPGSSQEKNERIDRALKRAGVDPKDIDIVILTHLHWDHCANLHFFKKARFYVQKSELDFASSPIPPYYSSYESEKIGLKAGYKKIPFHLLKGDAVVLPGVRVLYTPGHSPGHQSVVVRTPKGSVVMSGDAIMCYDNLKPDKRRRVPFSMIGRYMDYISAWSSMKRIVDVADVILPSHDMRVYEKAGYP